MTGKVYIGFMRSASAFPALLPLLAAGALAWPLGAAAQGFAADYGLSPNRPALFNLGPVRFNPVFETDARYSGAGLSMQAGRNWFAQVGAGRSLQLNPSLPASAAADVVNITGGYRWSDGQSLSLQLNRARTAERLGLSVSYDWPRYFVRLTYDSTLAPVPQDSLRFSAGIRF